MKYKVQELLFELEKVMNVGFDSIDYRLYSVIKSLETKMKI